MSIKLPAMAWFAILFTINVVLALIIPPSASSLQLLHSDAIYHVFVFTLFIPYGLIWGAAFYAYEQLGNYTRTITDTVEGRGFARIVLGIRMFAWGLILSATLSLLLSIITHIQPDFTAADSIINRYATLAVTFAAFLLIQSGTYVLFESVRARRSRASIRALVVVATIVGALFIQFVAHNQSTYGNPYYLPFYVLLATLLIPYIYAWTIGILGATELRQYARRVKGILYQRALQHVAYGLTIVILASVMSQYLGAIFASKSTLSVGGLLIIIYICLLIAAGGLVLIALGAKQLKKIEEI